MDLIATHLNADFDGLASMVAARKLYPDAALVLPGGAQEALRAFLAVHDLGLTRLKDLALEQVTRLIVVDTREADRLGPLKDLCGKPGVALHVYDHHPDASPDLPADQGGSLLRADLSVNEPVGATTTLLVERLRAGRHALTPFEATVLALGLYEETGSMSFTSTTPRDLEAAAFLLQAGADLTVVNDTLRRPLDPEQIAILNDLLANREVYYLEGRKVLVAASTFPRYRSDLADVVQKLAEMEGLDAVIVAVAMEEKVELIGRSRRPEAIDVARLLEDFGGGGHAVAAAASVKGRTLVEVREKLVRALTEKHRPTLLARDVMTTPVKSAGLASTVLETEGLMTRYGVNVLPVLDGRERYRGLISREAIQQALFHGLGDTPVEAFMRTDQFAAAPETPFREIEQQMIERNQRFVPVLEGSRVIGVITRTDLLRVLHDDVLAAARVRAKGEGAGEVSAPAHRRNVKTLMRERLSGRIYHLLEEAGRLADRLGVSAFVVGGFVRDLLLGRENLDVDLVIEGDGIAFGRALAKQGRGTVKVHERFGTAVVTLPDGGKVDVATARTEYYEYPTALPTVERSSIKKDLYRRDFTINTLAIRVNGRSFGEVVDFFGGQRDLHDRVIRVLHSLSFVEDPTRVFRAVRFAHRFGFHLGKETLALIKGAVKMDLFHRLSGSRLFGELALLFSESEPRHAVRRLAELDVLRFIHPAIAWDARLAARLKAVEDSLDWYRIASLAWTGEGRIKAWRIYVMALLWTLPEAAVEETVARLALPARDRDMIRQGRQASRAVLRRLSARQALRPAEIHRMLAGLSDEVLILLLALAKSPAAKRELAAFLTTYRHVKPSVDGAALKAMGLKPGPQFKRILDRLLEARLNGEVKTEQEERALARRLAKPGPDRPR